MTYAEFEQKMDLDGRLYREYDGELYQEICAHLPKFEPGDFAGCGPHSYLPMAMALETVKPRRILEIGFNLGHSSLYWLKTSYASVDAVDIRDTGKVRDAADIITKLYPKRFRFSARKDFEPQGTYELSFIDGSHELDDVLFDLKWCQNLKIPYLLMDDWLSIYGGVQRAVFASGLKILWVSGNQALLDNTDSFRAVNV